MKICPNCHTEYENQSVFCKQCGSELQDIAESVIKKTTSFFDKCEEIEDQAICKKSGVKFYPKKGFKK